MVDYSSTKGAIITFTRSMAQQLAPKGIRVNVSRAFSGLVGVCLRLRADCLKRIGSNRPSAQVQCSRQ
jgi:hypothetical protein